MIGSNDAYQLLIAKLDEFIRKYYINKMLRGGLYFIGLALGLFLLYTLLEYEFYFSTTVRKFLFFSYLAIIFSTFSHWVGAPLFRYFRLGKQISHEQAAVIIGHHFEGVRDKLLNILQLHDHPDSRFSKELIEASIAQKSEEIRPVPFKAAIDLGSNRRYVKYALPPFLLLLAFLVAAPNLITEPTQRIIRNSEYFEREAPFRFVVDKEKLQAPQYQDFDLEVRIEGDQLPAEVVIDINGFPYSMRQASPGVFRHRFSNVQEDIPFFLRSGDVRSADYILDILEKPVMDAFSIRLDYPSYTGKADETLENIGDLTVPAGTKVQWRISTRHADSLAFRFGNTEEGAEYKSNNNYLYTKGLYKDGAYQIQLWNQATGQQDSLQYIANVIPDQFPSIEMREAVDSLNDKLIYLAGGVSDDYGISRLLFHYTITHADGSEEEPVAEPIAVVRSTESRFQHVWELDKLSLSPGDELRYYFEVWDNDAVNGAKSSRTGISRFAMPTLEEVEELVEERNEDIKESLKKSMDETRKLSEEIQKLRDKLLQEKELNWQSREDIEKLLDQGSDIQKEIDEAREQLKESLKEQEQLDQQLPEDLQNKKDELEKLFEESQDQQMQELMDKIQEMLQELNKDDAIQMMEQFQQSQEQSEQNMERLMELFKQLEVELEAQRQIEKLEELAEQQEELSKQSEQQDSSSDSLAMEQEKLNDAFDKLQEKMEELQKKNDELQRPKDLGEDLNEQMEDIEQDMDQSSDELQQEQKSKASKSQKKAAQKMKKMAQEMRSSMESSDMEQAQEDLEALRQLLENLVTLSFDQEDLVNQFNAVRINTPEYVSLIQDQFKLKGDFALIQDSLNALAQRVVQIEAYVTQKIYEVNENLEQSLQELHERRQSLATEHQRRTMKNVNDLALMLSEAMQQMQEQMSNMMPGNQMCNKPGGAGSGKSSKDGRSPMDKITEGQDKLGESLQKMQQQGGKEGENLSSKDFAKAAAQQAALRKMLQDIQNEKQKRGNGDPLLQQIIEEMDRMEVDLVNKRLTNEMLRRQQEIKTRLLEAERAEREREWDNKRKSNTAQETERQFPPSLEEYIKQREAETDFFKPVSPELLPFYKTLVDAYYNELKRKS